VIALAGIAIFLVRRSSRARDDAEAKLRDNNLNLETTVDERTADLREANDEIQRFAYIVSHDLRSPLVNIMGFTSELEELRGDIFKRIAALSRTQADAPPAPDNATDTAEPVLDGPDKQLSEDFSEALGFIKSSIAKMDRLISAILNLTREGRREFEPVRIDTRELIEGIVATVAHQAAEAEAQIRIEPLPNIVSDRLALEQIFSNLIDNALKYLKQGVPGDSRSAAGPSSALRSSRYRTTDAASMPRTISASSTCSAAPAPGPDRGKDWAGACPRAGAAARRNHVGRLGTSPRQHVHDYTADQLDHQ
jgi:Bacteriophytochrome (light-regulated signal transduction histidine kinase)